MKALISALILSVIPFNCNYAFTSDDALHPAAHVGSTYIITHAGEVICKRITGLDKTSCSIISGSLAMTAGVAIELKQTESSKAHGKGLAEDAVGVLLAVGIIHLDF